MNPIKPINTLVIDIGGTFIKMVVLDQTGKPLIDLFQQVTPQPSTLEAVLQTLHAMINNLKQPINRISIGFPGVVYQGSIITAPNMHQSCIGVNLQNIISEHFNYPTRVINDADMQGLGNTTGKGLELMITLGTGVGSALFINGHILPNLELAHHMFRDNQTYEQRLGIQALRRFGIEQWQIYLQQAITAWEKLFNYDVLYIDGGHAPLITFELPPSVKITSTLQGYLGGLKLWCW